MSQDKKYFSVIKHMTLEDYTSFHKSEDNTVHFSKNQVRNKCIDTNATPIDGFVAIVDKKHPNGLEVHALYSDGSIRIHNLLSKKLVTVLMARPNQAKRIMDSNIHKVMTKDIEDMCYKNVKEGKNQL